MRTVSPSVKLATLVSAPYTIAALGMTDTASAGSMPVSSREIERFALAM